MDESNSSEGILWQEDYHDSMNGDSYEQYFANSLGTNVSQGSLIVIDNAPYHSRNDETYPVSKWKKQQYIDWLKSKDIAIPKKILRAELGLCANRKEIATRPKLWRVLQKMQDMKLCASPRIIANSIQSKWFGGP